MVVVQCARAGEGSLQIIARGDSDDGGKAVTRQEDGAG
jgi:hypothetical protein